MAERTDLVEILVGRIQKVVDFEPPTNLSSGGKLPRNGDIGI
jgi:hypothetical protein